MAQDQQEFCQGRQDLACAMESSKATFSDLLFPLPGLACTTLGSDGGIVSGLETNPTFGLHFPTAQETFCSHTLMAFL